MDVSTALREMCAAAGLDLQEASTAAGRNKKYISNILRRGSVPQADTLALLAKACGFELVLEGHGRRMVIDATEMSGTEA